jgi:sorbitol-specific phosphotransferase system component IIA
LLCNILNFTLTSSIPGSNTFLHFFLALLISVGFEASQNNREAIDTKFNSNNIPEQVNEVSYSHSERMEENSLEEQDFLLIQASFLGP